MIDFVDQSGLIDSILTPVEGKFAANAIPISGVATNPQ
jgi:hypothetical protein